MPMHIQAMCVISSVIFDLILMMMIGSSPQEADRSELHAHAYTGHVRYQVCDL